MKSLLIAILGILTLVGSCVSCSTLSVKTRPEYPGVDPRAQSLVGEYLWLSKQNNIRFYNKVTLGFSKIPSDTVIGYCTVGPFFREVDIDIDYWNNTSNIGRMALIYHELTHCYCGRHHDYSKTNKYPATVSERISRAIEWKMNGGPRPGYWSDGCPVSIMYPVIVEDDCMLMHYQEYVNEMFNRCKPW